MKTHWIIMASALTLGIGMSTGQAEDIEVQYVDKDCWVEIFEDNAYDPDDPHVKIGGPMRSSTLANFNGKDWNDDIESLVVGPHATVRAYSDRDYEGTEVAFVSNQRIRDLAELDMANEIESMQVQCHQGS